MRPVFHKSWEALGLVSSFLFAKGNTRFKKNKKDRDQLNVLLRVSLYFLYSFNFQPEIAHTYATAIKGDISFSFSLISGVESELLRANP